MQKSKNRTWSSDTTPEATFAALLGVVQNGKFKIFALNNEHHKVLFTSGKWGLGGWEREYIVEVEPASGKATLNLQCGLMNGRPTALLDGWMNNRAADKMLEAVQSALAGGTSAPVQQQDSFSTTTDGSTIPWSGPDLPTVHPGV